MSILELLRSDGYITVNKRLIKAVGVDAAIFYSELLSRYFYFKERDMLDESGEFFNTVEDMEEATSLTRKTQPKAIQLLVGLGLINSHVKGVPPRRYFYVNENDDDIKKTLANGAKSQLAPTGLIEKPQRGQLKSPNGATNNNNLIRPINKNIEQVSKARSLGKPTEGSGLTLEPLEPLKSLNPISKKVNIFSRLTNTYGEDRRRDALRIIDEYIDKCYPAIRNQPHPHINKFQRAAHAEKLLACEDETEIDMAIIIAAINDALRNSNSGKEIFYMTTPNVLGYWLSRQEDISYESLIGTIYEPVEVYY